MTAPAIMAQLKPCEELIDNGKAISRVLLSTSASPAVMMPPGAALQIAAVFDLPPNAARDLENRFGSSSTKQAGSRNIASTQAANAVMTTSTKPLTPTPPSNASPSSKNAVLAAFANRSRPGSSAASPITTMHQQALQLNSRIPGVTPPLIDLGTPAPTPPPSEIDVITVLMPLASMSGVAGLGPR